MDNNFLVVYHLATLVILSSHNTAEEAEIHFKVHCAESFTPKDSELHNLTFWMGNENYQEISNKDALFSHMMQVTVGISQKLCPSLANNLKTQTPTPPPAPQRWKTHRVVAVAIHGELERQPRNWI